MKRRRRIKEQVEKEIRALEEVARREMVRRRDRESVTQTRLDFKATRQSKAVQGEQKRQGEIRKDRKKTHHCQSFND